MGDSTSAGIVEILIPTVIEIEDLGTLPQFIPLSSRFTDDQLRTFVFDGESFPVMPTPVPLPDAGLLLLMAISGLILWKCHKKGML